MKILIHVNQHIIKANRKNPDGPLAPPLTVKTPSASTNAYEAIIKDERGREVARVVYRPNRPLSCGAHVWVETNCRVQLLQHAPSGEPPANPG